MIEGVEVLAIPFISVGPSAASFFTAGAELGTNRFGSSANCDGEAAGLFRGECVGL